MFAIIMEKTIWTKREAFDFLKPTLSERQVQFYSEEIQLPDLTRATGRGKPREYSRADLIALRIIGELSGYGMNISKIRAIMGRWYNLYGRWWEKQKKGAPTAGYLTVYKRFSKSALGDREGMAVEFHATEEPPSLDMAAEQSVLVLNVAELAKGL